MLFGDGGELGEWNISGAVVDPAIGLAGFGVDRMRNELLATGEHFDRVHFEPCERMFGAVNEQTFRSHTDAHKRRVAEQPTRQPLDVCRDRGVFHDVDVNPDGVTTRHPDPGVGVSGPYLKFE